MQTLQMGPGELIRQPARVQWYSIDTSNDFSKSRTNGPSSAGSGPVTSDGRHETAWGSDSQDLVTSVI